MYSTGKGSFTVVVEENFFQNAAQMGNFLYGVTFSPLKCGEVGRCRSVAILAVKTPQWCSGALIQKVMHIELKKVVRAQH